ncbi:non-ribosomal peptide synthetase [Limnoraphis robusta]|uniref:non-ribosomal peptide synthetase n=1 Tax=Limnoraphis robusta TaxID=1118279 RepID=UPI002B20294D|nr:amino acid adenylation domain-containing protein [Limnoraphis robusta]MEA5498672.1 amino acid adenylation domain-containing protein [Limnoraphis robusta BA-68 BA1]
MKSIDEFLLDLYRLDVKLWVEGADKNTNLEKRLRFSAPEERLTDDLIHQLKQRKSEIISFISQVQQSVQSPLEAIQPVSRQQNLPLSFAQQRLWFLEQLQPDTATYTIPSAVRLTGELNIELFEKSLNEIIRRHEILRTNFIIQDGQPVQVISENATLEISHFNLQPLDKTEQEAEVIRLMTEEAQKPFNLVKNLLLKVTLLKLEQAEFVVLLTMHHIISDGWSMEIFIRELVTIYTAFCEDKPSPLPELSLQYADFAISQRQWLQGEVLEKQLSYWKQQLQGTLPVLQLPSDFPRSRVQSFRGDNQTFVISEHLTHKIKAISQAEGVTLFVILLAVFNVLLYRYTGLEDIIVGSPVANRNRKEIEGLIGFFVNTLVLRSSLKGNPTFREFLQRVKKTTWEAYDHQDLPFEKLVEHLHPERDLSYNPLFQVKFRLENAPQADFKLPDLSLSSLKQTNPTAKLDLSLDIYETSSELVGGFEYNQDLFKAETISRLVEHFQTLLEEIVKNPDKRIGELSLLTPSEQHQILKAWNQTQKNYTEHLCFHHLFEQQVNQTPDAVALIFKDEQLTYQELNQRSNQLAHYLIQKGVKPEVKVGICVERSFEMIIALLGVFKAGGAYLPLDANYPAERLAYMVEDSQISVLLTQSHLSISQTSDLDVICLDKDWNIISKEPPENPQVSVSPDHLAYLIYTSGSTGLPKGVLIPHNGLVHLTEDKIRVCQVHADSCVLQFFSFSFDASIPEIIMALASGGKLCLAPVETLLPGKELLTLLRNKNITHITITPSALAATPFENLPALEMVLVGGEAPSVDLINHWSKNRRFINAYGPTEVTVNASMVECGNGYSNQPTIRPSTNKQLYVLDSHLQPVPVGVLGELYIAGVGLARGYLNQPEKTAQTFIPNPFYSPSEFENSSNRLYKTGDLAGYLPDGSIKLFGRVDHQVKIRGFRIEPGEIEVLLNQHPQVRNSVVIVQEEPRKDKRLVAYFVVKSGVNLTSKELRNFLKEKLPEYMIPISFVELETIPLTPNGKVDHQALSNLYQEPSTSEEFVAPRNPTEEILAEIFAKVLEVEGVGIYDDFFELGGHSLLATQLIAQLLPRFPVHITVIDLFEASNVASLAELLQKKQTINKLQTPIETEEEREEIEF